MWLWMRGSVDPAALSIVGPPSARGSIWTTLNHWLAPRRLLGLKCPSVAVGGKANSWARVILTRNKFMAPACACLLSPCSLRKPLRGASPSLTKCSLWFLYFHAVMTSCQPENSFISESQTGSLRWWEQEGLEGLLAAASSERKSGLKVSNRDQRRRARTQWTVVDWCERIERA